MKKGFLSWILIVSMILTQAVAPAFTNIVYASENDPQFISGKASNWIGRNPRPGDSMFYIEVEGKYIGDLEAEIAEYDGNTDTYIPIASELNKWYLGKSKVGYDRYVCEMIVNGGGTLSNNNDSLPRNIRLKNSENYYFDTPNSDFYCFSASLFLESVRMPKEIVSTTQTLPFEIMLHGADSNVKKDNIAIKLYDGISAGWSGVTLHSLLGNSEISDIYVTGTGTYHISGDFTIDEAPQAGDTLFIELEYDNLKAYTNSPIHVLAPTALGQFTLSNAISNKSAGPHEGSEGYKAIDNSTYFVGIATTGSSITTHKFTLTGGNLASANNLAVADNDGNNILRSNSATISNPKFGIYTASGIIDVPEQADKIIFSYDGNEIHSVSLTHTAIKGSVSFAPLDAELDNWNYKLPEDTTNFKISLSGLNLPTNKQSYSVLIDGNVVGFDIESSDGELVFNVSSTEPLNNEITADHSIEVLLDGSELSMLTYDEYNGLYANGSCEAYMTFGDYWYDDTVTVSPALKRISGNRALTLYGESFSSGNTYTANFVEHNVGALSSPPQKLEAQYVSPTRLNIPKNLTDNLARGIYEVYLTVNNEQINGLATAVLTPSEDIVEIINPTVKINNGDSYTLSKDVLITVNSGTFTGMRYSEIQDKLETVEYSLIANTNYTLSDGYGKKTIYFEFIDDNSRTYKTTATINYRLGTVEAPSLCGIAGITNNENIKLYKYSDYTLYLQASEIGYVSKVDLADELDNVISTLVLNKTSSKDNLNTYSKRINIGNEYVNTKKLYFYFTDAYGLDSDKTEIPVSILETPYINSINTEISTGYTGGEYYATYNGAIKFTLKGKEDHDATAAIVYKNSENSTLTSQINLIGNAYGTYTATDLIPVDAAELISVNYRLTDPDNSENYVEKSDPKLMKVFSSAFFTNLPNTGDFNGKYLRIRQENKLSSSVQIDNDKTEFFFNKLLPGNYTYSIFDYGNIYKTGEFTAQAGNQAAISLSDTRKPASLYFNVETEDSKELSSDAYIMYTVKLNDSSFTRYSLPNETILGLTDDMVIESYTLVLPYSDLKIFEAPETITVPVNLNEGSNSINISVAKMDTVKVKVTVYDSNVVGRTIPEATIYANQFVTNNSSSFNYYASGTTDSTGSVELTLFPDTDVTIEGSKENYNHSRAIYSLNDDSLQQKSIDLTYADQNKIRYKIMALPLASQAENSEALLPLEALDIIDNILIKDEAGNPLMRNIYNNTIYLDEDMFNKTVYIYPRFDYKYVNKEECFEVKLDEYGNGTVELIAVPKGIVTADVKTKNDIVYSSYMVIYNDQGHKVSSVNDADGRLSSSSIILNEGNYTVVVFYGNGLSDLNNLYDISSYNSLGLIENTHYIKRNVVVKNGKINYLGVIEIPEAIDKSMLNPFTLDFTSSFEPQSSDGTVGKIHVKCKLKISDLLKSSYKLKNIYASTFYYSELYNKKVNNISSNFGNFDYTPDTEGNYTISFSTDSTPEKLKANLSVFLTFEKDGVLKTGRFYHTVDTPQVSLIAPTQVINTLDEITVRGMAFAGSTIEIYDDETLIGSTIANDHHSYNTTVTLISPNIAAIHKLKAKMITTTNEIYQSEFFTCEIIDDNKRASVSNFEFKNLTHAKNFDDPKVKSYSIDKLGSGMVSSYVYAPNELSRVSFRINKLVSSQLQNVYVINTDRYGRKSKYPATLVYDEPNGKYSDWNMEAVLGQHINDLSVFYSLKDGEDMGILTGFRAPSIEQFNNALNNLENLEPANIPQEFRSKEAAIIESQSENHLSAYKDVNGVRVGISVDYTDVSGYSADELVRQGYLKVPVGNTGEYYLIKTNSYDTGDTYNVSKTMYLSSGLAQSLKSGSQMVNMNSGIDYASTSPVLYASAKDTVRDISGKVDYAGYVQNTGEIAYEGFRNRTANLGNLGKGMQVIGGVATAVQIFSGPASIDPANLRALTDKIKDSNVRSRLRDEITEYRKARTDSHSISSLMGVVSYGSSFFSLPGKCLSYVVSTGNMVFTQKIDAEYNLWGNGILSQIAMQLRKEEHDVGEEDDPDDPKWLLDPSGYVFEAIDNQRVEGITATVQTDNYGDWAAWNDEFLIASEQKNPQTTNKFGRYAWDVPSGNWRVMFEDSKGQYQTSLTKAMTVPPPHTEVNIGLISNEAPLVNGISADTTGIEIEFSMYMQPESIYNKDNSVNRIQIIETATGEIVPCEKVEFIIEAENTGYTSDGIYQEDILASEKFTKRIQFKANEELYPGGFKLYEDDGITPKEYTVTISENVLSYSGVKMDEDYTSNVVSSQRLTAITPTSNKEEGKYTETITVSLITETEGADIYYTTDGKNPTATSFKYTEPIEISESCYLKAIASKVGMDDSSVFSSLYIIGEKEIKIPTNPGDSGGNGGNNGGGSNENKKTEPKTEVVEETLSFKDVTVNDWFYKNIRFVVSKGLFKGITIDKFEPYGNMTRAMLVTVLFRLDEGKNVSNINFKDVEQSLWYSDAVSWASENNIVTGYGNGLFGPNDNITREQLATILYRLAKLKKYDVSSQAEINSFNDYQEVSTWALEAMKWMYSNKLINGKLNNILDPKGFATRAEVAAVLQRFIENIIK